MRKIALLAGLAVALSACASIMHGTTQEVGVSSTPTNAKVIVDGAPVGVTPVVIHVSRKASHTVHMELDGYQPFDATLTHSVSGWVWGNLVFGGLIGLGVDAATGGLYKIDQNTVAGTLTAVNVTQQGTKKPDDDLVIRISRPDSTWHRIGSLTPIGR